MATHTESAESSHGTAAGLGRLKTVSVALAVIVLSRLVVMPWPTMWAWGLNTQRFLAPAASLALWGLMALPFVPGLARWLGGGFERLGDTLATSSRARVLAALLFAVLVFVLEDRTLFTGDSLIRRAATPSPEFLARFRQALPLEMVLFEALPLSVQGTLLPVGMAPRLIGLAAAFALGLAALGLGRDLAGRGSGLVAVASMVAFGGHLATFSGLGKPVALLCALTAIAAVLARRVAREGRGLAALGATVFVALLLHRAGVLLLPVWALALVVCRRRGAAKRVRGTSWALAMLPLVALGMEGGRILRIATTIDLPLHAGSPTPLRLLDPANLALLMTPGALPVLLGALGTTRERLREPEAAWALAMAGPWILVTLIARPAQGIFRDLDFFAAAAVALSVTCAWLVSRILTGDDASRRVAAALSLVCAGSALQLLVCFHDPASGLTRVYAYVSEAPARPAAEREPAWDFLSLRAFATRDWPLAAAACEQAVKLAPSPRLLIMLGIARTYLGDYAGARKAYSQVVERSPHELIAWAGLAGLAGRLHDPHLADSALVHVRMYPETSVKARELEQVRQEYPEFWPDAPRSR
jgi:hypothetical protein